jgi:hypothetical protein
MLFGWFRKRKDDGPAIEKVEWEPSGPGMVKNVLAEYPDGFVIYCGFNVAGITFQFVDAARFANSQSLSIELEREPTNKHDRNAIKVIGVSQRARYFVGHVPKDICAQVARSGLCDVLLPRLTRIYTAEQYEGSDFDHAYLEIQIQLVGPKAQKTEFQAAAKAPRKRKAASGPA